VGLRLFYTIGMVDAHRVMPAQAPGCWPERERRRRGLPSALVGGCWLGRLPDPRRPRMELRVTFVAVRSWWMRGHRDDRRRVLLLYDTARTLGRTLTRRQIARSFGSAASSIDRSILSHADLDHFNGLAGAC